MTSTKGDKELKTNYPVEEGLTAETQKQEGRQQNLVAERSLVQDKDKEGIR